jgi:tetratricopeptide (TPR) repeat protein
MREDGGRTALMDFGLGRDLRADGEAGAGNALAGTPPYMAPELLAGEKASEKTDIYAFGVLLYFLVTGEYPASGRTVDQLRGAHMRGALVPLRKRQAKLPENFVSIVERATAPRPEDRFANAATLAEALNASLRRAISRSRWYLRLAIAFLILIAGSAGIYLWPDSPGHRPWVLVADFENQTSDEHLDLTVRELLSLALEQSRHFNVFPRRRAIETLELMRLPKTARLDLAVAGPLARRESISTVIGGAIASAGQGYEVVVRAADAETDQTRAVVREAIRGKDEIPKAVDRLAAGLRASLGERRLEVAQSSRPLERVTTASFDALERYTRGLDAYSQGQAEPALDWLRSAVERDGEFAMAHRELATIYSALGRYDDALAEATRAWSLRDRATERERHLIEGIYHVRRGDFVRAVESYRLVTVLYPQDAVALYQLAQLQATLRDYSSALAVMARAAALNPRSAFYQGLMALLFVQANQPEAAREHIRHARASGADGPYLQWCEALAWMSQRDFDKADSILRPEGSAGGVYESLARMALAQSSILRGRLADASAQLETDAFIHLKNEHQLHAARARFWLAQVYLLKGDRDRAVTQIQFVDTARALPSNVTSLRQTGLIYARLGAIAPTEAISRKLDEIAAAYPSIYTRGVAAQVRGELQLARRDTGSARNALETAWTLWGDSLTAYSLARCYEARREFDRALRLYQAVIDQKGVIISQEFSGTWVESHLQAARCSLKLERFREAASYYDEFLKYWGQSGTLALVAAARQERQSLMSLGL